MYPNPSKGIINFAQSIAEDINTEIRVMNYVGQTIYNGSIEFTNGKSQLILSDIVSGIYMIEVKETNGKTTTLRVSIEK